MAFELGWQQTYISRRLTGEVAFDVDDLAAIAEVLGVPVTVFFDGPEIRRRGFLPSRPSLATRLTWELAA